jgi:predicted nucleotidyltransferase
MKNEKVNKLSYADISKTLAHNNQILKRFTVKRIGIFGSYAKANQKKRSDIDFVVEFEQPTFDNFMNLLFQLQEWFKREVDLVTYKSLSPHLMPYIKDEIRWYEI